MVNISNCVRCFDEMTFILIAAQEEFGWKLVHGDVFRAPRKGMVLAVLLGSGVQIFCMSLITLLFACLVRILLRFNFSY